MSYQYFMMYTYLGRISVLALLHALISLKFKSDYNSHSKRVELSQINVPML